MATVHPSQRSFTGRHTLLPAASPRTAPLYITLVPDRSFVSWTFGRGTVLWRIWPAVVMHTIFAAGVVTLSLRTSFSLDIPPVLLTVLGVVIGFVISYRASSGYDRYWMGRSYWSDMIRNVRQVSRLIWLHVPTRLTPKTPDEISTATLKRSEEEVRKVTDEKRLAMELLEGFVVAVKHHLRGEMGIYYEDLYQLVKPLHNHPHHSHHHHHDQDDKAKQQFTSSANLHPSASGSNGSLNHRTPSQNHGEDPFHDSYQEQTVPSKLGDPAVPPINAYGTFDPNKSPYLSHRPASSSSSLSDACEDRPLLPGSIPRPHGFMGSISEDLVPFASFFSPILRVFRGMFGSKRENVLLPSTNNQSSEDRKVGSYSEQRYLTHMKHRPAVAGGGENMPMELLWRLSAWFAVLEERQVVPGTSIGMMIVYLGNMEDTLAGMEKILTTPLPFVFSAHISTVWIYLFFMPFQLLQEFGWYTIPGVGIAAFIYLGFLAAGEEIEQPFGYDENDLDLDLFCREVVHAEMGRLKKMASPFVYSASQFSDGTTVVEDKKKEHKKVKVQDVFGALDAEEEE